MIVASHKDPTVPQAKGGLVYEFFLDPENPNRAALLAAALGAYLHGAVGLLELGLGLRINL